METSEIIGVVLGVVVLTLGLSLLFALPIMWLWNWLCPDLFNLHTIGFFQAWGLGILCGLLFKSTNTAAKSN